VAGGGRDGAWLGVLAVGEGEVADGVGVALGVGEEVGAVLAVGEVVGVVVGLGEYGPGDGVRVGEDGLPAGVGARDSGVVTGGVAVLSRPMPVKCWWWAALADGWAPAARSGGWWVAGAPDGWASIQPVRPIAPTLARASPDMPASAAVRR
jgi:hypothetical protein